MIQIWHRGCKKRWIPILNLFECQLYIRQLRVVTAEKYMHGLLWLPCNCLTSMNGEGWWMCCRDTWFHKSSLSITVQQCPEQEPGRGGRGCQAVKRSGKQSQHAAVLAFWCLTIVCCLTSSGHGVGCCSCHCAHSIKHLCCFEVTYLKYLQGEHLLQI